MTPRTPLPADTEPMLLSSVAEHLFWAGRYLERAEGTARLVRTHTELLLDLPRSVSLGWAPLLAVTGTEEAYTDVHGEADEDEVTAFLLSLRDNPGSVVSSVERARENLRVTRAFLPRRSWEVVNEARRWATATAEPGAHRAGRMMWTEELIRRCHTVTGAIAATMNRDQAYAFLEIGKLLERADMTTRVLDVQAVILMAAEQPERGAWADLTWMSMLRSLGGEQMYRRRMGGAVNGATAVRFLLRDEAFPRSVEHCLVEISYWLSELPDRESPDQARQAVRDQLDSVLEAAMGPDDLHRFADELQLGLGRLHDRLTTSYFTPAEASGS